MAMPGRSAQSLFGSPSARPRRVVPMGSTDCLAAHNGTLARDSTRQGSDGVRAFRLRESRTCPTRLSMLCAGASLASSMEARRAGSQDGRDDRDERVNDALTNLAGSAQIDESCKCERSEDAPRGESECSQYLSGGSQ